MESWKNGFAYTVGTVSIPIYVLGSPCLQGFPFFLLIIF